MPPLVSIPVFSGFAMSGVSAAGEDAFLARSLSPTHLDPVTVADPSRSRFCMADNGNKGEGAFFPLDPWVARPKSFGVFTGTRHEVPSLEELVDWTQDDEGIREYAEALLGEVNSATDAAGNDLEAASLALMEIVRDAAFDLPLDVIDRAEAEENLNKLGVLEIIAREYGIFGRMIEVWVEERANLSNKRRIKVSGLIRERAEPYRRQIRSLENVHDRFDPEDDDGSRRRDIETDGK